MLTKLSDFIVHNTVNVSDTFPIEASLSSNAKETQKTSSGISVNLAST